jgi:hypothetical protein
MTGSPAKDDERGPFSGLLAAQVFFIGCTPFVRETGPGRVFLYIGVFSILVAGAAVSSSSRALTAVSLLFLTVAAGAWLGPDFIPGRGDEVLRLAVLGCGYGFITGTVIQTLARQQRVTVDTVLGGVNAYLLIACAFMMFHAVVMVVDLHAYHIGGQPLEDALHGDPDPRGFATLLYFSFTTLTTLGYGDIVPVSPVARLLTSVEAVVGQLYVAIFIARLVSLLVSQRTSSS